MTAVETKIQSMLKSLNPAIAKQGLANVLYWGYSQIGYGSKRVRLFCNNVTPNQIAQYQALVATHGVPCLRQMSAIGMPQYSGVSFLSKALMFLNPIDYCVLDLQLARIRLAARSATGACVALYQLHAYKTTIRPTFYNQRIYDAWRIECRYISDTYFGGTLRAVDIERGFFHLIQSKRLATAQAIYAAA